MRLTLNEQLAIKLYSIIEEIEEYNKIENLKEHSITIKMNVCNKNANIDIFLKTGGCN